MYIPLPLLVPHAGPTSTRAQNGLESVPPLRRTWGVVSQRVRASSGKAETVGPFLGDDSAVFRKRQFSSNPADKTDMQIGIAMGIILGEFSCGSLRIPLHLSFFYQVWASETSTPSYEVLRELFQEFRIHPSGAGRRRTG
ncbi:hypothetical protein EsDP_00007130 [Epichloe bromicola]|uniref:Uncharacterized protein n=1 Tax=Epichloe bromicola TaxID=79588 RepID=A0ABQ0CZM7_9HYPO